MRTNALLAAASVTALPIAMQRTGARVMATAPPDRIPVAMRRVGGHGFGIRAAGEPQGVESMFNQINNLLHDGFRQRDDQISNLTDAMTALQSQVDAGGMAARDTMNLPVDRDYTTAFASYFRRGDSVDVLRTANANGDRATVQAAMSVGSATDGGFLAPVEWDRRLQE